MKVGEFIEQLEDYNKDLEIIIDGPDLEEQLVINYIEGDMDGEEAILVIYVAPNTV